VILLESIADPKDGTFFPAVLEIAAENLQNAEAAHTAHSIRRGSDGKEGRSGGAAILNVGFLIFD
jgi:hypothetical protein